MNGKVNGNPATLMIDSGSSSNFLSLSFVRSHKLRTQKLEKEQRVQLADGSEHVVSRAVHSASVRWEGWNGMVSFLILPLSHHDAILGMSWLREFNPRIDWMTGKCYAVTAKETEPNQASKTVGKGDNSKLHHLSSIASSSLGGIESKVALSLLSAAQFKEEMVDENTSDAGWVLVRPMVVKEEEDLDEKNGKVLLFNITNSKRHPTEQEVILNNILKDYNDVFPLDLPKGIPPQRGVVHRINLFPDNIPPSRPAYRTSPADSAELKKQLDSLLDHGFIVPSTSPYGAPVLFVKKKDGSVRMCVDYRALNKITERNMSGLPRMDELFDRVLGAKFFSKLDLRSGYHQIPLHPDDRAKTAFNTRFGHFEFTVLPFGLTNAPATFSTLMQKIFHPFLDEFVVCFLDDILIFSKSEKDHEDHLRKALEVLRSHKLYAKKEKCEFFKTSVHFLGHIISSDGIAVEADKVKAIQEWPECRTIDEIRSFLGLCGFYRRFVKDFSKKALPLTDLTKKKHKWKWEKEELQAFNSIKYAVSHAPVLLTPDPTLPYTIATDASGYAVGAVLQQDHGKGLQPVAYMSKKLLDAERNYPVGEQEQLAIVLALKEWRHLIHGVKVNVLTDNSALQYLETKSDLSRRQARWTNVLAQYDLKITYQPGKSNLVADALSRRGDHRSKNDVEKNRREKEEQLRVWQVTPPTLIVDHELNAAESALVVDEIHTRIRQSTVTDQKGRNILQLLSEESSEEKKELLQEKQEKQSKRKKLISDGWNEKNGLLFFQNRLYVPDDRLLRSDILVEAHDAKLSGHLGVDKTLARLSKNYYWNGMAEEVKEYVGSCLACATAKSSNQVSPGLLQPLPIPQRRWEQVTIDFITQLPVTKKRKYDAIMVMVDKLSKMVHIEPTKTTVTAVQAANIFYNTVIRLHGVPLSIVSDRDPRFTSNFWDALWSLLGTKLKKSTAYHPQSDGQTEVMNKTIETCIRSYVGNKLNDWDEHLTAIEFAINSAKQSSTKFSPFQLNYGQTPNDPLSIAASIAQSEGGVNETANEWVRRVAADLETARHNLLVAQQMQQREADKHRREVKYEKGELVLLSTTNLSSHNNKLRCRFIGPFPIAKVWSDVVMELELPEVMNRKFKKFHVSKLKPWKENAARFPSRRQVNRPVAEIVNEKEPEWLVEGILGDRLDSNNKVQYLVLWEGYPVADATWEPESHLKNAKKIVDQYKADGRYQLRSVNDRSLELEEEEVELDENTQVQPQDLVIEDKEEKSEENFIVVGPKRRSSRIRAQNAH
jgi:hypothetical protein